jgi:hemoglobin-like flavoprotein
LQRRANGGLPERTTVSIFPGEGPAKWAPFFWPFTFNRNEEVVMTPEEKQLVQESFAKVVPIAEQAAALFYQNLFDKDPSLKPLFKGDMAEQGKKLMKMIATAVNGLDRLDAIVPAVQDLGRRHAYYGVKSEHYDTVGAALLQTLEQGLGAAFTPAVKQAWTTVYVLLATTMKDAAHAAQPAATATA